MGVGGGGSEIGQKERSFTNFQVTSLMLYPLDFIHFHIVLQSDAKQCYMFNHPSFQGLDMKRVCKRVLIKTLSCVQVFMHMCLRARVIFSGPL